MVELHSGINQVVHSFKKKKKEVPKIAERYNATCVRIVANLTM